MSGMISYLPPSLPGWLGAGGIAGVGFAFAKWFLEYVGGRMDKRAAALDAGTQRLIEGLEKRVNALTDRLDQVERDLAECNHKHALAEAEVAKLNAILLSRGEIRERAQLIVAAERLTDKGRIDAQDD